LHRADSRPAPSLPDLADRLAAVGGATARLLGRRARRVLDDSTHRAVVRPGAGPLIAMTRLRAMAAGAMVTFAALDAFAHVRAGEAAGFLSGVEHPISGLDHVAAMVAVGLWGAQLGMPALWVLPVAFPLVMAFGGFLGFVGVPLPGTEVGIAA